MKIVRKTLAKSQSPVFSDVKAWYNDKLHPSVLNLDDQRVYSSVYSAGNWGGIFQFTAKGAQAFCKIAQPKNIIDIAAITSIYRPGPLVAGVDKGFVDAKNDPDNIDYPHPLVKEVLGETYGYLVFQEQMLRLGNIVGKLPLEKCDRLRKVITKRSMSGKEKAAKESEELRVQFLEGAKENGLKSELANEIWDNMAAFKGYAFNLSHALSYAIDSYMCAWLLTYYESEWLCAYMETQSGDPDKRAAAINELRAFGYEIVKVDINHATKSWTIMPNKKFMPSFLTVKSVGDAAVDEIKFNRPYSSIYDLLWKEDGSWRHSKFNKRSLENLIKIGAFDSMDLIGEGKTFSSYRHMHHVLIENNKELRHKKKGRDAFKRIVTETYEMEPWSVNESVKMSKEIVGSADLNLLISKNLRDRLEKLNIPSIDAFEPNEDGSKSLAWFILDDVISKKSRKGNDYLMLHAMGPGGKVVKIFCWGWNPDFSGPLPVNIPYMAEISKWDGGLSTRITQMRSMTEKRHIKG